ncbi:putative peptidase precursor [Corynebacterium choanae]|uniref:Putative peptidase n=2 Tax=Corynebacterium choanae TaxID=1862358 RepID=A0A3G6J5G3_9CORY|nr:putative peptidase precursor [Corynebacterium choanae]
MSTPTADALINAYDAPFTATSASSARTQIGDMACTATLISPTTLLTAKHCIGHGRYSRISIGREHDGELRYARDVILHPSADLALVRLNEPSSRPPVPVSGLHLGSGMRGDIVGWGVSGNNPLLPVQASTVSVQRRVFHVPSPEPDLILIETFMDRGRIQRGDSGGPLFVGGGLAGVLSMSNAGAGNSVEGTIGWYTPVAEHLDWIRRNSDAVVWAEQGAPSPLIDNNVSPTYAPPPPAPTLGDMVRGFFPQLPYFPIPGLSS